MKLEIVRIIDRGIPDKERLHLRVRVATSLEYFAVFDTVYLTPESIESMPKRAFWFPKRAVQPGDFVILYTNKGEATQKKNDDGTTTHFFHWNCSNPLWDKPGNCAVVFELNGWQTTAYE